MSRRVLSQAGVSLADVYDVEGSIAGIDRLDINEIKGVHELGAQIHSERLKAFIVQSSSGAVAQSTTWGLTIGGFPDSINRLLAVTVIANNAARVDHCSIAIQEQGNSREIPVWAWDTADDAEKQVEWSIDGAAAATQFYLAVIGIPQVPELLTRLGDDGQMPQLIFRGETGAFGAGNVTTRALFHVARPNTGNPPPGEPSSHGLPIPGW